MVTPTQSISDLDSWLPRTSAHARSGGQPSRHAARGGTRRATRYTAGEPGSGEAQAGSPEVLAPILSIRGVLRRFWPYTRGLRGRLLLGLALATAAIPLETLATWLFKVLVDRVLQPASFDIFPRLAIAYVSLTVLTSVLAFATGVVMTSVGETFLLRLRTSVMAHLNTLSPSFFQRHQLGDLLSRVGGDVSAIETLVVSGVTTSVTAVLQVVAFGGMLFVVSPLLAATALTVTPVFWLISRWFSGRLKTVSRRSRYHLGRLSAIAEEGLSNVTLIQAYNEQGSLVDRFDGEGGMLVETAMSSARLRGLYQPLVDLAELIGLLLVVGVGTWQLSQGNLTLGSLLVFMAYFAQLYAPLRELGQLWTAAFAASAGAERIAELLDAKPEVIDDPRPWPGGRAQGVVGMSGVSFRYPGRDREALSGITFTIAPGQLLAVVGLSGSGKSTLAALLLRLYDPDRGAVLLDGQDVRDRPLAGLRDQISLVMQETVMFDGTLRDNIIWSRQDVGDATLAAAVQTADAASFVADLPQGLDTQVGQRGRSLSGGQRQRVALARALVRNTPILLLDEPTAGLDPLAEQRVLSALDSARRGRTTIFITHNLLSTRDADEILVLDAGQIVERGTYAGLVAQAGLFAQMLDEQLRQAKSAAPVSPDLDPFSVDVRQGV